MTPILDSEDEPPLGELIFGRNNSQRLKDLYTEPNLTTDQAREVLSAIEHPEMRRVIDTIQSQIEQGAGMATYDWYDGKSYLPDGSADPDPRKALLFTYGSYASGFLAVFFMNLQGAFPGYRASLKGKKMIMCRTHDKRN